MKVTLRNTTLDFEKVKEPVAVYYKTFLAGSNILQAESDNHLSAFVEVPSNTDYSLTGNDANTCCIAFLSTLPDTFYNTNISTNYATTSSPTGRKTVYSKASLSGNTGDAKYICVSIKVSGNDWLPGSLTIGGVDYIKIINKGITE